MNNFSNYFISTSYAATEPATYSEAPVTKTEATEGEKQGVAATLGINGLQFLGQLVTFAVVLLILWKWVFNPVTEKLQQRTEKIEKALSDADRITLEKQEFEQWRQAEMTKARQEAGAVISKAQEDANTVKDQTLHKTKEEQQKLVDQAKQQIQDEKNQQLAAAKSELADIITSATEKILRQKLDGKKDQELIKESISSVTR